MLIKGEPVVASRAAAPLLRHLLHGEENDAVTVLQRTEDDYRCAFADARALDRNNSHRHFIISPAQETSRDDALMVLGLLGREFGFDPAVAFVVEHAKPRAVPTAFGTHWHALVPAQDPATGRTLSSKFSYLRHQKISCIAAHRLGHPFIALAHTTAVLDALESDGHIDVAAALRNSIDNKVPERPREAFSRDVQQMAKRLGVNVPAARAAVRAAWETTSDREALESALARSQLRIRPGDKPETFIVDTLEGVFCGAAHRLARVRRTDFLIRMTGDQNVRSQSAEQREGVLPVAALGNSFNQGASGPTGPARNRQSSGGGSSADLIGIDSDNTARSADQSRSRSSTHGRHRSLYSRGRTRRFRQALNRNPSRLGKMVGDARFLARPPVERVAIQLNNYEEKLQGQIKTLLSRPPPSAALAAAQREATTLRVRLDKYEKAISAAQAHFRSITASEPRGLGAKFDGTRHRWASRLTAAETRCAALTEKRDSLVARLHHVKGSISEFEKDGDRAHSLALRSADSAARATHLRHQIAHISQCRARLNILPAIAWGGVAMVLGAMTAIELVEIIESESGPSTLPVLATDLWGVGLRNEPT